MITIYIDEQQLTLASQPSLKLNYDSQMMQSVEAARAEQDLVIQVEATPENATIFVGEGYLHAAQRFNAKKHTARIEYSGAVIFEGEATLTKVEKTAPRSGATMLFTLRIRRSGAQWAHNACETVFSKSSIDYVSQLLINNMKLDWNDMSKPVQFFPVHRDSYRSSNYVEYGVETRRLRAIDDYHPFLNVKALMESIFTTDAGYEIESKLMESEEFSNLYMSGAYVGQDSDAAKAAMNFCVKKTSEESTTASFFGRVNISPSMTLNTVSNIVDIESLETDPECFSYGDCFTKEGDVLTFTPLTAVDVGFEFRLVFRAGYYVESRAKLKTFDTYWLGGDNQITVEVVNTVPDEKGVALRNNFAYMPIVFDHVEGTTYRLMADVDGVNQLIGEWSDRTGYVSTSAFGYNVDLGLPNVLFSRNGSQFEELTDDWALYFGSDKERGEMVIDVSIRTAPESLTPDSPKRFNFQYIQGAEAGTSFKLMEGTSITPYFASYPGAGSIVRFEDLAQHNVWQSKFLEAIQHLYNLKFYTDEHAKKVYIEPAEELFQSDQKWDWSDRVVETMPIKFEDLASETYKTQRWGYLNDDGFTNRTKITSYEPYWLYPQAPGENPAQMLEGAWSDDYGSWSVEMESYAAKQSTVSDLNPMFAPTQNTTTGIPIVGDRDDAAMINTFDFTPKILRYTGEQIYDENEYVPHLTFHDKSKGVTLCFEDRDGLQGLNRYRRDEICRDEWSQYVTLWLTLEPHEVADLTSPVEGRASVLSTFLLKIEGEWAECRLEKIMEYEVGAGVAQCRFIIVK